MNKAHFSLTDIGINLTDSAFDADRETVIQEAEAVGVKRMLITGTTAASSEQAISLCRQYPDQLFCTAGVHPHYSKEFTSTTRETLTDLLKQPEVRAVGETGLDFNRNFSPPEQQIRAFEQQLELAAESGLPLFLHERDAHSRQVEMLRDARDQLYGGVAHCFTGNREELYHYLDLDLYIGITGWICDERRGSELLRLVKEIPADRLMLETDAPYLLPRDLKPRPKSRRNLPLYLTHILEQVARQRDCDPQQLAQQTEINCERLFRFNQTDT
ncbi:Sec-independent protein translocase TatD [Amphritea atlantica]|uniref:Sec-independent protein translocase TatD n=1 Tax=Amphritea atlantica TaxID=355243 RepID=A0A1H9FK06_9GAMM|nr:TatD family hydrolase [Amphritea atlantica]SEQ38125.1 Sec-independent protein translocase TatD [Amphritea atlantica]